MGFAFGAGIMLMLLSLFMPGRSDPAYLVGIMMLAGAALVYDIRSAIQAQKR